MESSLSSVHTLYLCYFGLREPLVQTQVLPYLRELVHGGARVSLLTFEPHLKERWTPEEIERERVRLAEEGIAWHARPYHKRPSVPATLYDVSVGVRFARKLIRREGANVLHARSHVPALMGALAKRGRRGVRLLFDIRGFLPEEYIEAGVWKADGRLYRGVKRVEKFLLASSDAFVVLTERAREIMFPGATDTDARGRPVEVIPCCVDFQRFASADAASREDVRRELNVEGRRVIAYVGALGGWYMTDEIARFFAAAHREDPSVYALILTQSDPALITSKLGALGIGEGDFFIGRARPEDVPRYLRVADVALSFVRPGYSKLSSSPTKIAEYLAAGVPVVASAGVGDVDELIETDRVGVVVREFTDEEFGDALRQIEAMRREGGLEERCRASAERRFDITRVGGAKYRRLYERLLGAAR
jgi:glycosyltransferase involved in cell wall biosynthesis